MTNRSSDNFDDLENTDELLVLLEPVEDVAEPAAVARHEDTANHIEVFAPPLRDAEAEEELAFPPQRDAEAEEELAALSQRAEQIPALDAQIRVLTDSMRDLEQRLAEKDQRLDELRATLASLPKSTNGPTANEQRLARELADRDAQIIALRMTVEKLEETGAARSTELKGLREAAATRSREADELRRELAARPVVDPTQPDLREAYATLQSYVAGRRAWWDEMQETNTRLTARATELEQELAARAKSVVAAEEFAAKESGRAVELRAELVGYARRAAALERELKLLRAPAEVQAPELAIHTEAPQPSEATQMPPSAPAPASAPPPASPAAHGAAAAPEAPPLLTDAVDVVPPTVEAISQLEAEVEYKRQQVAAQLVELRDREQQLRATKNEVGALRNELDDSRSDLARLERTVVDKDRALEARDARIAALHEELKQHLVEKRSTGDSSQPTIEPDAARHITLAGAAENSPTLICLTGDAPKRFALTKKTVTVGRGPHCDLQIITHFVSREHARLTVSPGATLIEDLGSRNGVFVNSVRVDRRQLQQGDLVTIGETQFRFVESVAH